MIEAYAFLAMFLVQILAMSALLPVWFIRFVRRQATRYPVERFAQMYPGVDLDAGRERFLIQYRAVNIGIVVIGFSLLVWFFSYLQRPDWSDGPVEGLVAAYFGVQALPICVLAVLGFRFKRQVLKHSEPEARRKATLQRRGLFDFVSPFLVFLAVLSYFLFVAFTLYIGQQPFPGFAGALINIGIVTLVYALEAACVYMILYGKKINPIETHADSVRMMGLSVKACVYACIACVAFLSLNFTLVLLDLQRWEPFALSAFLVLCALLSLMGMTAPPRHPGADDLGSNGRLTPRTPDLPA
ncbi:hypothetical protein HNQ60_000529 [Povalibacter uvarum]|uniref:Uncharacterized protein n=1 Tax=Povalibacter uvarum TaxID=732238 RepID=A0A841HG74_9GAMM|nr:hypothetical protein [Povalibacter uvarum]MBB6091683.1 hypothetical protein [Povalibacter uvarum]